MTIHEAKSWLSERWVLHPAYQPQPHHASHAEVDVALTFFRVRHRMRQERSFAGAVEQTRQRLRMVLGRAA